MSYVRANIDLNRRHCRWRRATESPAWIGIVVLLTGMSIAHAEPPSELPPGERPKDSRLEELKTLKDNFPFTPPKSLEAWKARREQLRRQLLVALGLWPMPTPTALNPVVWGKVERDGYTVERVYFESVPGHFVSGSLYRPVGFDGRRPLVLCPHGHWRNGRFFEAPDATIAKELASGAERLQNAARFPLQARCVQLVRMGCIVFHYDMIGNADSQQMDHRSGVREEMNTLENWGYFSPQAELRLQHRCGLQTYNSIRALDFAAQLPDVDMTRVGVTGASGGGTQTLLLSAVDPRVTVAVPAVMIGAAYQGGCVCENCSYLRVGTGNVEIAGLFAPQALGLIAADDWTKDLATKGLPELKQLYGLFDAEKNVTGWVHVEFPHNYNAVSREDMYGWMNRQLALNVPEPIVERNFVPLTIDDMTVWDDLHPAPASGDDYERSLIRWLTEDSDGRLNELVPLEGESAVKWRAVVAPAVGVLVGRGLPPAADVTFDATNENESEAFRETRGVMTKPAYGERNPVVFLRPRDWNKQVVIWVTDRGKDGLPLSAVDKVLKSGTAVASIDLYGQGDFTDDGLAWDEQRLVNGGDKEPWQKSVAFTFAYNDSLLAQRVHDLLAFITLVQNRDDRPTQVHLVGEGEAALWVAAARAQAGNAIDVAIVAPRGFRFATLTEFDDSRFWPGIVKYGDVPALLALSAPHRLVVVGEDETALALPRAIYEGSGQADDLVIAKDFETALERLSE